MNLPETRLKLSVALVCYEMGEQIENTLRSLLPPYQRNIASDEFEIILVDNGSVEMLPEKTRTLSSNLHYIYVPPDEARASPAAAINRAARTGHGPWLCLMIDGARMVTPGVFSWALRLLETVP